jgi:hypothetical protein
VHLYSTGRRVSRLEMTTTDAHAVAKIVRESLATRFKDERQVIFVSSGRVTGAAGRTVKRHPDPRLGSTQLPGIARLHARRYRIACQRGY